MDAITKAIQGRNGDKRMTKEEAIRKVEGYLTDDFPIEDYGEVEEIIKALEQEPCEDCISRTNALRVAKNEYLRGWHEALYKALNEKYSIHCEEGNFSVIQEETITGLGLSMDCAVGKDVENYMSTIPSVTPTRCITTVKFSKEDLRDICNERIEIECTHGTCKDCFYYNIDEDGHGYHCEKYGHTRFPVYADFYCKDFEKRGGENELN